jgi:nucleotide-binding universal stress UspA family protein
MYRKVLVPLDGSALAECALPHIKSLVREGAAGEVTLLNIYQVSIGTAGVRSYAHAIDIHALRDSLRRDSTGYLAQVAAQLASEGIEVKTVSQEGNHPADAIAEHAQQYGADLIVIATHGYTGLKKLMLGSVALGVLHESHIPVLLIRPESCKP